MNGKKMREKSRFDEVMLSDLEEGDRFRFIKNKTAHTFERYSESESGYIYLRDADKREVLKKKDLPVIFLRNIKKK